MAKMKSDYSPKVYIITNQTNELLKEFGIDMYAKGCSLCKKFLQNGDEFYIDKNNYIYHLLCQTNRHDAVYYKSKTDMVH